MSKFMLLTPRTTSKVVLATGPAALLHLRALGQGPRPWGGPAVARGSALQSPGLGVRAMCLACPFPPAKGLLQKADHQTGLAVHFGEQINLFLYLTW